MMQVLELTATEFVKPMATGRNHPLLFRCQNVANHADHFEVVVKFRGRELTKAAQMAELMAAQLADDLGLQVPQAAVVIVPPGFDAVIADSRAAKLVKDSPGPNFGSVHVGAGFTTWLPGRNPSGAQRDQAAEIFAFDTLIQNPDRRATNPNLWTRSDRLGVFDHDQAFSFLSLPIVGGAAKPWATRHGNSFRFLEQHIFYRTLRGKSFNLGPFQEKLSRLTNLQIRRYTDVVPADWRDEGDFCEMVADYLNEARQQAEPLIDLVKHILR